MFSLTADVEICTFHLNTRLLYFNLTTASYEDARFYKTYLILQIFLFQDIEDFLSSAKHGAIYVSFGSNLKASTMSQQKLGQFLAAFKSVPQKVLWKWEGGALPKGHENILAKKWFPQLDVLCKYRVSDILFKRKEG